MPQLATTRDALYEEASAAHGAAIHRLARSYELDPDKQRDLLQEIHIAIWHSLAGFESQCSLRTWVYRVAHNVAASHVVRHTRMRLSRFVTLEEAATLADRTDNQEALERSDAVEQIHALIRELEPIERQVILLYLEGEDAASIGVITGISAGNVATRIHRIKKILASRFQHGERDGQ
ncbi:MAG TPA: RNA polymerase sigma factor [Candidatus Polarisedimenticolaceae bacterium]|nr:RNA polymerase sigma factor [Candidatus Polarisedimenticolaceae bacterium]